MKTVSIKGKPYVMVNERLKAFRENFDGFALVTNIIELNDACCVMQAQILDSNNRIIATGTAREEKDDRASMVNKTSYVENCETSAWGRALGNFGIGIDESIATYEEVARAIEKQASISAPKTESKPESELTLAEARAMVTSKGTPLYKLDDERLQFIIEHSKQQQLVKAAELVLDDLLAQKDDIVSDEQEILPWD